MTCIILLCWTFGIALFWPLNKVQVALYTMFGTYLAIRVLKQRAEYEDKVSLRIYMVSVIVSYSFAHSDDACAYSFGSAWARFFRSGLVTLISPAWTAWTCPEVLMQLLFRWVILWVLGMTVVLIRALSTCISKYMLARFSSSNTSRAFCNLMSLQHSKSQPPATYYLCCVHLWIVNLASYLVLTADSTKGSDLPVKYYLEAFSAETLFFCSFSCVANHGIQNTCRISASMCGRNMPAMLLLFLASVSHGTCKNRGGSW